MTLQEFLDLLKICKKNWILMDGVLRTSERECPIVALCSIKCGFRYKNIDYVLAANKLGLSNKDAFKIATTSDNYHSDRELRKELLEITKPKELKLTS